MLQSAIQHPSSYRDPSGFVFKHNGALYRHVRKSFKDNFDFFLESGFYQALVEKNNIVAHRTIDKNFFDNDDDWYTTLEPDYIPFISYPYEWCFDQLKDAALLTLQIAREAVSYGMVLKDATPYNVQFRAGQCVFIDSLSFEKYNESCPWIAYRQFCENFFAPLAISHYLRVPMQNFLIPYIDGLPIKLAKKILPFRSKFNLHTFLHLHLQASYTSEPVHQTNKNLNFSRGKLLNLIRSLKDGVESFTLQSQRSNWSDYYTEANERDGYLAEKKEIVSAWITRCDATNAVDIGANDGEFSLMLSQSGISTISADSDHTSVNRLYNKIKQSKIPNIYPVVIDLTNPTPAVGFNNQEHSSFLQRSKSDLVLALALIHHLTITHNIPFERFGQMLSSMGKLLIIEFVPREDEKVQTMLRQKTDIYGWHTEDNFLNSFSNYFELLETKPIGVSGRTLYLMRSHD